LYQNFTQELSSKKSLSLIFMIKSDNIRLSLSGLPIIQDLDDFSALTHVSKYTLYQLSRNAAKYYKVFSIAKKNGGSRVIAHPSKKLKGLQAWILFNILYKLNVSSSCKVNYQATPSILGTHSL
jgi:RNA-directed DNA polymerase